jgi:hypothetical protein
MSLSSDQIETFVETGAVKLENAFARETAEACSNIVFRALGLSPAAPDQWKEPVLRITAPAPAAIW